MAEKAIRSSGKVMLFVKGRKRSLEHVCRVHVNRQVRIKKNPCNASPVTAEKLIWFSRKVVLFWVDLSHI
jgi:hypothetical protein